MADQSAARKVCWMTDQSAAQLAVSKAAPRAGRWVGRMTEVLDSSSGGSLAARWGPWRADNWGTTKAPTRAVLKLRMMSVLRAASWVRWRSCLMVVARVARWDRHWREQSW